MRGVTMSADQSNRLFDLFQSTLPMRGVTESRVPDLEQMLISIHTPHAGSDHQGCSYGGQDP